MNDIIHPVYLNALRQAVPELFSPGTLLNVGANQVRFQLGGHLARAGREITLLEAWPANASLYMNDRRVKRVEVGDVRELGQMNLGTFDACLWWHGPEHIEKGELAGTLTQLESAARRLVVLGCPYGVYPQGPFRGNPYDAHRAALYPADLEALGYQVVAIGQADHPDGGLIAWKHKEANVKKNSDDQVVHVVMQTHGGRRKYLEQTIPAVLNTPYPLTLTVVAGAPDEESLAYLKSVKPKLYRLIVNRKNLGKPPAANQGWRLRAETAAYTMLLDDDALPVEPDWLRKLVDLADIPQIGIVGHSVEGSWPLRVLYKPAGQPRTVQVQPSGLGGACMLVPRRTVELAGYYNEELGMYGECDALFGWKVRRAGLLCAYFDHSDLGRSFQHLGIDDDPEYRTWKNDRRVEAIQIRDRLIGEYAAGTRPLNQ